MKLEGKKALITGGGRGIGRVTALTLAQAGADIAIAARTKTELGNVCQEIREIGRNVIAIPADVSNEKQVQQVVDETLKGFGQIDILINNAATFARDNVVDFEPGKWKHVIDVNLYGPFLVTHTVLPSMIQRQSGTVVMISSTAGKRADAGSSAYCASKFGLMGLAQSLLYEVRKYNIRVVVITPSYVNTQPASRDDLSEGGKGTYMHAHDIADSILHAVSLPPRALVREIEVWGTNP